MQQRYPTARLLGRAFGATLALTFAFGGVTLAQQQQPPAAKPAEKKPPAAQKPAAQKPAQTTPAQTEQAAPAGQDANNQPQLMYSPWIKVCNSNETQPNSKPVCVTAKDGRLENGMPVAAVALIEPQGDPRKLLRITVPLGMQLQHGTRLIIDAEQPATAPYFMCFPNGCMADYEANGDMVAKLKKGKTLTVQAINMNGQPISLPLPLNDFAKAYDGPPTDPKVFEDQQRKLQDELQKKADEARKKLENQQPSASAPK